MSRSQNLLGIAPVNVSKHGNRLANRITIHGDANGPLFPQDRRDVGVEGVVVNRISPSQDHHGENSLRLAKSQGAFAQLPAASLKAALGRQPRLPSRVHGLRAQAERLAQPPAGFDEFFGLHAPFTEINTRGQHLWLARGIRRALRSRRFGKAMAQYVRPGLNDGADRRMRLALQPWNAAQHGQEDKIGSTANHFLRHSMKQLHRRAEGRVGQLNPPPKHRAVRSPHEFEVEAGLVEEGREEGEQSLQHELIRHRDAPPATSRRVFGGELSDQFLPLAEGVGRAVRQFALSRGSIVQGAPPAPSEDRLLPVNARPQPFDPATVPHPTTTGRRAANKAVLLLDPRGEEFQAIQRRKARGIQLSYRQQGDAQGADGTRIGGNKDLATRLARDRRGQGIGGERHSLAKNHLADRAVCLHPVQVVLDDGIVETGEDGGRGGAGSHGLVNNLGHEHRAVLPEGHAGWRGQGLPAQLGHVLDAGEFGALFLDEGTGAGAARLVHGAIRHPAVGQADVLGVLPPDLKNRVHTRVVMERTRGVGHDFIHDENRLPAKTGQQQRAHHLPPAAGNPERDDLRAAGRLRQPLPQQVLRRADRIAQGPPVTFPKDFPVRSFQHHQLGARGTNVQAHDQPPRRFPNRRNRPRRHALNPPHRISQTGQLLQSQPGGG